MRSEEWWWRRTNDIAPPIYFFCALSRRLCDRGQDAFQLPQVRRKGLVTFLRNISGFLQQIQLIQRLIALFIRDIHFHQKLFFY